MNAKTAAALADIRQAVEAGQSRIAPALFSPFHGRAATSAAFRAARAAGIIEVAYTSCTGTPVYRGAGVGEAMAQAATTTVH